MEPQTTSSRYQHPGATPAPKASLAVFLNLKNNERDDDTGRQTLDGFIIRNGDTKRRTITYVLVVVDANEVPKNGCYEFSRRASQSEMRI